jgi:hypothetical protein
MFDNYFWHRIIYKVNSTKNVCTIDNLINKKCNDTRLSNQMFLKFHVQ